MRRLSQDGGDQSRHVLLGQRTVSHHARIDDRSCQGQRGVPRVDGGIELAVLDTLPDGVDDRLSATLVEPVVKPSYAGIVLGLELSLNTDEYVKLLGLVAHPAVRAYWDATGTESMVHNGEGIKGIEVLGASIVQMHLKNNREPLMEVPGLVDWSRAWPAIKKSGFDGWFALWIVSNAVLADFRGAPAAEPARRTFSARFVGAEGKDVLDQRRDRSVLVERDDAAVTDAGTDLSEFFKTK